MKKLIYIFVIVITLALASCRTKKAPAPEQAADSTAVELVDSVAVQ
jgi:hypothetical protein